MKHFIIAIAVALSMLASLIVTMASLVYIMVYLWEEPVRSFNIISIPMFFISAIVCVLSFKIGMFFDQKQKAEIRKENYDKYINPDNAETLRFSRKNPGVSIGRFYQETTDQGISLFFIQERIWCCLMRHDDGTITAHLPPEIKAHNENIKFIERINVEDLPRIS